MLMNQNLIMKSIGNGLEKKSKTNWVVCCEETFPSDFKIITNTAKRRTQDTKNKKVAIEKIGVWKEGLLKEFCVSQSDIKVIGKNLDTLRIEKNGITYVKFRAKDLIRQLKDFPGDMDITLVSKPNLNEWGGKTTPQVFITDLEIEDSRFAFQRKL